MKLESMFTWLIVNFSLTTSDFQRFRRKADLAEISPRRRRVLSYLLHSFWNRHWIIEKNNQAIEVITKTARYAISSSTD